MEKSTILFENEDKTKNCVIELETTSDDEFNVKVTWSPEVQKNSNELYALAAASFINTMMNANN